LLLAAAKVEIGWPGPHATVQAHAMGMWAPLTHLMSDLFTLLAQNRTSPVPLLVVKVSFACGWLAQRFKRD
jgi:hypothetical protein